MLNLNAQEFMPNAQDSSSTSGELRENLIARSEMFANTPRKFLLCLEPCSCLGRVMERQDSNTAAPSNDEVVHAVICGRAVGNSLGGA